MNRPVTVTGAGGQSIFERVKETEDDWKGHFPCLQLDAALQRIERRSFPSLVVDGFFERGPEVLDGTQRSDAWWVRILGHEPNSFLPQKFKRVIGKMGTRQIHPEPILLVGVMLTDEGNNGLPQDVDVDMAIDRVS